MFVFWKQYIRWKWQIDFLDNMNATRVILRNFSSTARRNIKDVEVDLPASKLGPSKYTISPPAPPIKFV